MRKVVIIISIVVLVLLGGGILGWSYIKSTPQYSILKMYQAVDAHDYETFIKYADLDTLADSLLDGAMQDSEGNVSGNDWEELGRSFAEGIIEVMRPALKERIKSEVRKQIEAGDFGDESRPAGFVELWTRVKVEKEGKVANVSLIKNGKEITLKMRDRGGYWQVFDMDLDIQDLQLDDSQANPSDEKVNNLKFGEAADIGEDWFLTVSEPLLYVPDGVWNQAKEGFKLVATEVVYENKSSQTNYFSLSNLKLKDSDDYSYSYHYSGKEPKLESGDLEAGGRVKGLVTFEVPDESQVKLVVYSGSYATVVFSK